MTTPCPSCATPVSDKALTCPQCGHPLRKARRGPIGTLAKWSFILFNLLMLWWLGSYWGEIAPALDTGSEAERAGSAIGATIGTGMIMGIWALGVIILGLFTLLTRPKG